MFKYQKFFANVALFVATMFPASILANQESADKIEVDFSHERGRIKPLHGVNNSPVRLSGEATQHEFAAAGIPFMRTHDAVGRYGGSHFIDIPNIFPNFDADETDSANYDFAFTDAYLKPTVEAGVEIFYRLGVTIETDWRIKAYNIHPPKDFAKWARICEHIIRHYNEGWANGFKWNIKYWEIWGEPENPPLWSGTRQQYFDLYRITSNHLKKCFPDIKIGGYGSCGFYAIDDKSVKMRNNKFYQSFVTWFEEFCRYVNDEKTKSPIDFFSWHLYLYQGTTPERIACHAEYVRKVLDANGLKDVESSLNEWNWNPSRDWLRVKSHEGAAVMAGAFAVMQNAPIDTAMYYDATPTRGHCGLFYFPNIVPTPTYYSFMAFNELYKLGTAVDIKISGEAKGLYALAAKKGDDAAFLLSNTTKSNRIFELELKGERKSFLVYRIAKGDSALKKIGSLKEGEKLTLSANSVLLLTTCEVNVASARNKKIKVSARNINGLDG